MAARWLKAARLKGGRICVAGGQVTERDVCGLCPAGRSLGVGPAGVKNADSVVSELVSVG